VHEVSLAFCSFASGSKGNCYFIQSAQAQILIDIGINYKKLFESLTKLDLRAENISAILITHEHTDHIRGLPVFVNRHYETDIYATAGVAKKLYQDVGMPIREISAFEETQIADMTVRAFPLSHDSAEPVGYTVSAGGKKFAIITDTGEVSADVLQEVSGADLVALEANYDIAMLKNGDYPDFLKTRILSKHGHLSNKDCGALIERLMADKRTKSVLRSHISENNNKPEIAYSEAAMAIENAGRVIAKDVHLEPLFQGRESRLFVL
jgi:phosphoribosyl 1,2-cyclic phosphodiesterase